MRSATCGETVTPTTFHSGDAASIVIPGNRARQIAHIMFMLTFR